MAHIKVLSEGDNKNQNNDDYNKADDAVITKRQLFFFEKLPSLKCVYKKY